MRLNEKRGGAFNIVSDELPIPVEIGKLNFGGVTVMGRNGVAQRNTGSYVRCTVIFGGQGGSWKLLCLVHKCVPLDLGNNLPCGGFLMDLRSGFAFTVSKLLIVTKVE